MSTSSIPAIFDLIEKSCIKFTRNTNFAWATGGIVRLFQDLLPEIDLIRNKEEFELYRLRFEDDDIWAEHIAKTVPEVKPEGLKQFFVGLLTKARDAERKRWSRECSNRANDLEGEDASGYYSEEDDYITAQAFWGFSNALSDNRPESLDDISSRTLELQDDRIRLWAHCVSEHAAILDPTVSIYELMKYHQHEHEGPGTIRGHDVMSRVFHLSKLGKVLSEADV